MTLRIGGINMLCQNCGKNEVNFRYTQIINNVALVPIKNSVWSRLFKSISRLFGFNSEKSYYYEDK